MTDNTFQQSPTGRLYIRFMQILNRDVPSSGLRLLSPEGKPLLLLGALSAEQPITELNLGGYRLHLGKDPQELDTSSKAALRSAARLMEWLLENLRPEDSGATNALGAVSFANFAEGYMTVLKSLETRTSVLENYEQIMHLNNRILLASDLASVLQIIMDMARDALEGEGCSLLLVDPRTGEMYFNVVSGENDAELKEIRIPSGQGIAGDIVRRSNPEIISDVPSDPRSFQQVDQVLNQITRNMAVAPLVARGHVIGVIEVINSRATEGFSQEDLDFLVNIASHTSLLIENARSKEELIKTNQSLDRKASEVNTLYEIGRVLRTSLDPEELRRGLLRALLKLLRIPGGSLLMYDSETRRLIQHYGLTMTSEGIKEDQEHAVYHNVQDILLWMKENREPFSFMIKDGDYSGLSRRFQDEHPDVFHENQKAPVLWIPINQSDDTTVDFILSLYGDNLQDRNSSGDLAFFRSIMNQADAAFRHVNTYHNAVLARNKEQQIRQVFQKYVPARVIQEVLEHKEQQVPHSQKVTILFADIRNFTGLAETLAPTRLVEILNEFFEAMEPVIDRAGGIIDKYIGDSLMALFGVPASQPEDAANGVRAAMNLLDALEILNKTRAVKNEPIFKLGIGIHTGQAIAGNVGSERRMDYTVIGDTVNIAARLEQLTKLYRSEILMSEETRTESGLTLETREVDLIQVRGRSGVSRIHQILQDPNDPFPAHRDRWTQSLEVYREGDFKGALALFEELKQKIPEDYLTNLYIDRCQKFIEKPPESQWRGVFKLDG